MIRNVSKQLGYVPYVGHCGISFFCRLCKLVLCCTCIPTLLFSRLNSMRKVGVCKAEPTLPVLFMLSLWFLPIYTYVNSVHMYAYAHICMYIAKMYNLLICTKVTRKLNQYERRIKKRLSYFHDTSRLFRIIVCLSFLFWVSRWTVIMCGG